MLEQEARELEQEARVLEQEARVLEQEARVLEGLEFWTEEDGDVEGEEREGSTLLQASAPLLTPRLHGLVTGSWVQSLCV